MDNYYILRWIVRYGLSSAIVVVMTTLAVSCNIERRANSALEVLCFDSRIGPFEFRQKELKDIIEEMAVASRAEWYRCGMHDSLKIEVSGSKEWLNRVLSFRIEESPILVAFHRLKEISNSDVVYSDGIISIRELMISKEREERRFEQFRSILLSVYIDGSIHHDVYLLDLLQRLYKEANAQLNKNGHPSMGLACNTTTNVYFKTISIPTGSIYNAFESVAGMVGAKVEYLSGNIIVAQTNDVLQSMTREEL